LERKLEVMKKSSQPVNNRDGKTKVSNVVGRKQNLPTRSTESNTKPTRTPHAENSNMDKTSVIRSTVTKAKQTSSRKRSRKSRKGSVRCASLECPRRSTQRSKAPASTSSGNPEDLSAFLGDVGDI
jgi:hypothetical protein